MSSAHESRSSWAANSRVRKVMIGNRSRDTKPELAIRQILHGAGMRYRVATRPVSGVRRSADIVFTRQRLAVFVDGCFWHGCEAHYVPSKTNADYWGPKIEANKARDRETDLALAEAGWIVYRVWAHEAPASAAEEIRQLIISLRTREIW